jgi:RNase P protein component
MLPKSQRITLPEFSRNRTPVKTLRSEHMGFITKKGQGSGFRVCVVVAKKLDKRSSRRHKTKRIIIEAIRSAAVLLPSKIDCLIRMRAIITDETKTALKEELVSSLRKIVKMYAI